MIPDAALLDVFAWYNRRIPRAVARAVADLNRQLAPLTVEVDVLMPEPAEALRQFRLFQASQLAPLNPESPVLPTLLPPETYDDETIGFVELTTGTIFAVDPAVVVRVNADRRAREPMTTFTDLSNAEATITTAEVAATWTATAPARLHAKLLGPRLGLT